MWEEYVKLKLQRAKIPKISRTFRKKARNRKMQTVIKKEFLEYLKIYSSSVLKIVPR